MQPMAMNHTQLSYKYAYGLSNKVSKIVKTRPACSLYVARTTCTAEAAASQTALLQAPIPSGPYRVSQKRARVFMSKQDCLNLLSRIADTHSAAEAPGNSNGMGAGNGNVGSDAEAGLISQVIDALYEELEEVFYSKRGYLISKREAALVEASGGSPTYGEITGEGVTQFLARVPLQPDDVLIDLGSGLGRLTLQVAATTRVSRCVGLELAASRHGQACWVAGRLRELGQQAEATHLQQQESAGACESLQHHHHHSSYNSEHNNNNDHSLSDAGSGAGCLLLSPVQLRCEDMMTADWADGTAFFLCSTAFSAAACRAIAQRLADHPPFRLLVTSRALPFPSPLTLLGQFTCAFTWTAAGTAYVYVRSLADAPPHLLGAFLSAPRAPPSAAFAIPVHEPSAAQQQQWHGDEGTEEGGGGGVAWLPSTCTMSVLPADLMV